jgi:hypothetical protein
LFNFSIFGAKNENIFTINLSTPTQNQDADAAYLYAKIYKMEKCHTACNHR